MRWRLPVLVMTLQYCRSHVLKRTPWINYASKAISSALFVSAVLCGPHIGVADVRLNAPSAAGTRVNSDAESLLRYGLPISNKEIRQIQKLVEEAKLNLKSRRITSAQSNIADIRGAVKRYSQKIVADTPQSHQESVRKLLLEMTNELQPIEEGLAMEIKSGSGSTQQRAGLDRAMSAQTELSHTLSALEEQLVPLSYTRAIPQEFSALPALQRRAEVEMVIRKPDNSPYDVDGKLYDKVTLRVVVDGYNAPITGGNFVDLVNRGFYSNKKITRADGFVVQTGDVDPSGTVHGYVPPGTSAERTIPLEIALQGEKDLLYGSNTEEVGRGASATVLPFQSFGALGMARGEFENDSGSSQFFWLLFESDLTPAGKNILDGRYACFGYTTDNAELLKGVKEGDIVESARVVKGIENLHTKNG